MNDETLMLYYYDELSHAERREVEAALAANTALAERYRVLREELGELMTSEAPAAPSHLIHQWHDAIDQAADRERVASRPLARPFFFGSFSWGAVAVVALALGIAIGIQLAGDDPAMNVAPVPVAMTTESTGAFSRGLLVHFRDSREQLAGINPDMNGERQLLIQSIIDQNRLFERMAEQNDAGDLARVLRAFEPVLVRLAAEDVSAEEAARLLSHMKEWDGEVHKQWKARTATHQAAIDGGDPFEYAKVLKELIQLKQKGPLRPNDRAHLSRSLDLLTEELSRALNMTTLQARELIDDAVGIPLQQLG